MIYKTGLAQFSLNIPNNFPSVENNNTSQIGKVYGVITTENTPTKELFENYGGYSGIGTVWYLDYNQIIKEKDVIDLSQCSTAKPFHASNQNYPLIGELIYIID